VAAEVRQVLNLFKLRIGVAIAFAAAAGLAVESGSGPGALAALVLVLAVLMASAAAGAFNQYVERDLDARMGRTKNRPFVTGALRHGPAWLWLIGALLALSVLAAAVAANALAALYVFLGAFTYGVVYTVWLKRRTWWNIVVGDERAARAIFASALLLVAASLVPAAFGLGWIYLAAAAAGGLLFLLRCHALVRRPARVTARAAFLASLAQLGAVLAGAMLDAALLA
jgi:protoheme IX farnesyltransferase